MSQRKNATLKGEAGQITIFFATTTLVIITFIAFIVNIGIFVKAKINLQNAVDAAAYAGASVQARQLTNIAYLNWEMRNVYKEWMFKTYVLGNMSLPQVNGTPSNSVDFRMESHASAGMPTPVVDSYNIPSTCLDLRSAGDVSVCRKVLMSGLPRFSRSDTMGVEEVMDTFIDALSEQKAKGCAQRTYVNFLTSFIWAYNVIGVPEVDASSLAADAPAVANDRGGAFPEAFDLALRIRNLEAQVNKKPYQGVCLQTGSSESCQRGIEDIVANEPSPSNERIYKAFYSGFKNLGGTDCGSGDDNELKCSFTLTELAPKTPPLNNTYSLSRLLIPANSKAWQKYYLDLKLMPANFATFFTMLVPVTTIKGMEIAGSQAEASAECVATKVGMPVPGYPIGFVKNPNVVTYYAVQGESDFIGLFNPFAQKIKLKAYAAAKPFGGRIGPMLFNTGDENSSTVLPRMPFKTSPYISVLDNSIPLDRYGAPGDPGVYEEGMPIPGDYGNVGGSFWLKNENGAIGGWIESEEIHFAIPNIPYDYPSSSPADAQVLAGSAVQIIKPGPNSYSTGLYNGDIFNKLKSKLPGLGPNATVTIDNIYKGILSARAPTLYDTYNYLVPTPESLNREQQVDSYGVIINESSAQGVSDHTVFDMALYAPLIDENDQDSLYKSPQDLIQVLNDFTNKQEPAILKYRGAMNIASKLIFDKSYSQRSGTYTGLAAAKLISHIGDSSFYQESDENQIYNARPACDSINGNFVWFYGNNPDFVNAENCDEKNTLERLMTSRWLNLTKNELTYYTNNFTLPTGKLREKLFSAYRPGQMNDANAQGMHKNFLNNSVTNMSRNFYSAKFVSLNSVSANNDDTTFGGRFAVFSEGRVDNDDQQLSGKLSNSLEQFGVDLSQIQH